MKQLIKKNLLQDKPKNFQKAAKRASTIDDKGLARTRSDYEKIRPTQPYQANEPIQKVKPAADIDAAIKVELTNNTGMDRSAKNDLLSQYYSSKKALKKWSKSKININFEGAKIKI